MTICTTALTYLIDSVCTVRRVGGGSAVGCAVGEVCSDPRCSIGFNAPVYAGSDTLHFKFFFIRALSVIYFLCFLFI